MDEIVVHQHNDETLSYSSNYYFQDLLVYVTLTIGPGGPWGPGGPGGPIICNHVCDINNASGCILF